MKIGYIVIIEEIREQGTGAYASEYVHSDLKQALAEMHSDIVGMTSDEEGDFGWLAYVYNTRPEDVVETKKTDRYTTFCDKLTGDTIEIFVHEVKIVD